jgi:hypothetical protein
MSFEEKITDHPGTTDHPGFTLIPGRSAHPDRPAHLVDIIYTRQL